MQNKFSLLFKNVLDKGYNLILRGKVQSCGCVKEDNIVRYQEMIGKKIDRLTIKKLTRADANGRKNALVFACECECGTIVHVAPFQIGIIKSCGCLFRETSKSKIKKASAPLVVDGTVPHNLVAGIYRNNTSGCKGVSWDKAREKWKASICFKKKHYRLGSYDLFEDAVDARKKAEKEIFGEYLKQFSKVYPERYHKMKKPAWDEN